MTLPAIPTPSTAAIPDLLNAGLALTEWAQTCDDVQALEEASKAWSVVTQYLTMQEHAREAQAVARRLEQRIGEVSPDRQGERTDLTSSERGGSSIPSNRLAEFRKMAAHPAVVDQVINESTEKEPPSRNRVLEAIREVERAAKAETEAFKQGLREQKEWMASLGSEQPGDDWRRRDQAGRRIVGLLAAVERFTAECSVDDFRYAIATEQPYMADGYRRDLTNAFDQLDKYRESMP